MVDLTFRNINRLYIQSTKAVVNDPLRHSLEIYFMTSAEIKYSYVFIHTKNFFEQLIKSKQELYGKIVEMLKQNNYATENLVDLLYHQNYYELIGTELSRKTNTGIPQQITFIERLEEENDTALFVSLKSSKRILPRFNKRNRII